ncbi:cytochrome c oxidase accessory protein CcoG [soil metagenome]
MKVNTWDLDKVRPASIDAKGWRIMLHPSEVKGLWFKRRKIVHNLLIAVFLLLPWLKIHGQQALLLNVGDRQFNFFGLNLRAHNAPLMFFVLAIVGFGLFFLTSVYGRAWCGWACPQTVFIESVFRRVERWIEGPATVRRAKEKAPMTPKIVATKTFKWFVFTVLALVLTHSFLAYFVGTDRLFQMITSSPEKNWASFLFVGFSTAIILFDFGWFREQFCIVACPYGRFQSVLMDSKSLIVGYDEKRGEPRRGVAADEKSQGDCVNCYRCVQVCPTGIDIRRGVQMECIACTACIDACDDVMAKTNRPSGLIRYTSLDELAKPKDAPIERVAKLRLNGRNGVYLAVVAASALALAFFISRYEDLDIQIFRGQGLPYQAVDGGVNLLNQFYVETTNTSSVDVAVSVEPIQVETDVAKHVQLVTSQQPFNVRAGRTERIGFFLKFPADSSLSLVQLKFTSLVNSKPFVTVKDVHLVRPIAKFSGH